MTIATADTCSLPQGAARDVQISVTFNPAAPVGQTDVEVAGVESISLETLDLLLDAARRLATYVHEYRAAADADAGGKVGYVLDGQFVCLPCFSPHYWLAPDGMAYGTESDTVAYTVTAVYVTGRGQVACDVCGQVRP